jgi:hypothetical protein
MNSLEYVASRKRHSCDSDKRHCKNSPSKTGIMDVRYDDISPALSMYEENYM